MDGFLFADSYSIVPMKRRKGRFVVVDDDGNVLQGTAKNGYKSEAKARAAMRYRQSHASVVLCGSGGSQDEKLVRAWRMSDPAFASHIADVLSWMEDSGRKASPEKLEAYAKDNGCPLPVDGKRFIEIMTGDAD